MAFNGTFPCNTTAEEVAEFYENRRREQEECAHLLQVSKLCAQIDAKIRRGLIFALRANGATFRDIAAELGISPARVRAIDARIERDILRRERWLYCAAHVRRKCADARAAQARANLAREEMLHAISTWRRIYRGGAP
jgi:hypothetical protein